MAYVFQRSDGTQITVPAGTIDNTYSLGLVGRDTLDYGETIVRNTVHHLENFAASIPPPGEPLVGQLWYDLSADIIRVYDGNEWKGSNGIAVRSTAPTGNSVDGETYYNTQDNQLYIYNNSDFSPVSIPGGTITSEYVSSGVGNRYGTKIESLFLLANDGTRKAVLAMKYVNNGTSNPGKNNQNNETIMAIISDHTEFVVASTDSNYAEISAGNGIGIRISKGQTFRSDYMNTSIETANVANRANVAYALDTASTATTSGTEIAARDIFSNGVSLIPRVGGSLDIGDISRRYRNVYVENLLVGSSSGGLISFTDSCNIGTSSQRVSHIYTEDISISGNFNISSSLGTAASSVSAGFFNALTITGTAVSETTPTSDTHIANKAYVDGQIPSTSNLVRTTGDKTISGMTSFSGDVTFLSTSSVTVSAAITDSTASTHVATKGYVDTVVGAIDIPDPVAAGTVVPNTGDKTIAGDTDFTGNTTFTGDVFVGTAGSAGTPAITPVTTLRGNLLGTTATFSGTVTAPLFSGQATSARYADLAEIYEADEDYEPGTLVKIGGEKEVTLMGGNPMDYFGVVSTKPGYLMNADATGLPIALKGRVPVKVVGMVKKGDRLVPSAIGGVAIVFQSYNDTYDPRIIVGRALEDKKVSGVGLVETVVGVV